MVRITEVEIRERGRVTEAEPSRFWHNDHRFRAPVDLRRTEAEVERILVACSCMADALVMHAPSAFPVRTGVDHILSSILPAICPKICRIRSINTRFSLLSFRYVQFRRKQRRRTSITTI